MGFEIFGAEYASYRIVEVAKGHPDRYQPAHRVIVTKESLRYFFRKNHTIRYVEGGGGVAIFEIIGKDTKEGGVDVIAIGFIELFAADACPAVRSILSIVGDLSSRVVTATSGRSAFSAQARGAGAAAQPLCFWPARVPEQVTR